MSKQVRSIQASLQALVVQKGNQSLIAYSDLSLTTSERLGFSYNYLNTKDTYHKACQNTFLIIYTLVDVDGVVLNVVLQG